MPFIYGYRVKIHSREPLLLFLPWESFHCCSPLKCSMSMMARVNILVPLSLLGVSNADWSQIWCCCTYSIQLSGTVPWLHILQHVRLRHQLDSKVASASEHTFFFGLWSPTSAYLLVSLSTVLAVMTYTPGFAGYNYLLYTPLPHYCWFL